jgi:transglutaminase-like putative cysteine protease
MALLLMLGTLVVRQAAIAENGRWPPDRRVLLLAVLSSMMVVTAGQADAYLSQALQQLKSASIDALADKAPSGYRTQQYVRSGDLHSIFHEQNDQPGQIALRVESTAVPGYMRGLAFETFDGIAWRRSRATRQFREFEPQQSQRRQLHVTAEQQLFAVTADGRPQFRMVVHNDAGRGLMYFTPLQITHLAGKGQELVVDDLGVVVKGIEHTSPYTVYASGGPLPDDRTEDQLARLLVVPPTVADELPRYAAEVVGTSASATEKIAAVEKHFRSNYAYSLKRVELPSGVNPVLHFLEQRPAAHCEYFATAAALLLRASGVPCRYVTGYVTTEPDPDDAEAWLARNRNAHAWVEAYVNGSWTVVEATPGMDAPKLPTRGVGTELESLDVAAADSGMTVNLPWLEAIWGFLGLHDPGTLLQTICALFLVLLGFAWLWRRGRRSRSDAEIERLRQSWDRALARRQLLRRPDETLHEFAQRLRQAEEDETCLAACQWYTQYADCVYRGSSLAEDHDHLRAATQKMLAREPYWLRWRWA